MRLNRRIFVPLSIITVVSVVAAGSVLAHNSSTPVQTPVLQPTEQKTINVTAAAGASSPPVKAATQTAAIQPAPICQRGSYSPPAEPAVSASQPGLHQNIIAPAHYTVYGNTVAEINNQINSCTPVTANSDEGRFAASTDYAIAWNFNYQSGSDGLCHINQVSVGINVTTVFPNWQSTAGVTAGTAASWQRFISSLNTHENGHIQLDTQYAQQILNDLQNYPATDCASIVSAANGRANLDLALLDQANNDYDAYTNHGATQGATLN